MSLKSDLYNERKASGVPLTQPYANYTVDQLQAELAEIRGTGRVVTEEVLPPADPPLEALFEAMNNPPPDVDEVRQDPPAKAADPEEMPGQRLNTKAQYEVIRVDEQGREWYQEEVRKPAYPKPRGRRVLKYIERGVEKETVTNGEYVETFEVAGKGTGRPAEVKITLPSYQVGIYKDPRFPFRIHCYDGREGFDLFEVQEYYGGSELVPEECKRVYIENDLCYDIRTVIRAIQTEHRQLQLTGRVK